MKFAPLKYIILYILEQHSIVSTAANEFVLAPLSKQTESFHPPCEIDAQQLPAPTAWLGYFKLGLPRTCC
jgi:hypothetical protein